MAKNLISHILKYKEKSVSQHLQDIWVLFETDDKRNGFFVEFGATDGKTISNTLLLERDFDWTGILAEPNPVYHKELVANRPTAYIYHKCVFTESGSTVDFLCVDAPDISTIAGFGQDDEHAVSRQNSNKISVETITLYDLLEECRAPKLIDYLSIDTEGSEFDILKAFFETNTKYTIDTITVEHNWVEETRTKLYDLLTANGYERKFDDYSKCDDFYKKVKKL